MIRATRVMGHGDDDWSPSPSHAPSVPKYGTALVSPVIAWPVPPGRNRERSLPNSGTSGSLAVKDHAPTPGSPARASLVGHHVAGSMPVRCTHNTCTGTRCTLSCSSGPRAPPLLGRSGVCVAPGPRAGPYAFPCRRDGTGDGSVAGKRNANSQITPLQNPFVER